MSSPVILLDLRGMGERGKSIKSLLGRAAEETILDSGDVAFLGLDPWKGTPISVGGEIKTLRGLLGDIKTDRVSQQLERMREAYDRTWLLIEEGPYRVDDEGFLIFPSGRESNGRTSWDRLGGGFLYSSLDNYLTSAQERGTGIKRTQDDRELVRIILNLYSWYQKEPGEHDRMPGSRYQAFSWNGKVSLRRKIAAQVPGIGWSKSKGLEDVFPTTRAMMNATVEELMQAEGIGKILAERIVEKVGSE